eukprot:CAMPEP_0174854676 /NCGR_PEP_ID=MMETSP1114-20130205/31894_1 /TAXON_ID=312471 /ORGANISM="Neobodo designis, Strain CCAP 1951/1" /LENGTH=162 /DNA_ID=CAMNT_0016089387 /DNA_START=31 /DNA_END=519 /DNA_ORIENTATION=+
MSTPSDEAPAPAPTQTATQAPAPTQAAAPPAAQPSDDFLVEAAARAAEAPREGRAVRRVLDARLEPDAQHAPGQREARPDGVAAAAVAGGDPEDDQPGDVWMVVHGVVYDCSSWARFHPGGDATIMEAAGRDGTALFDLYHRWVAVDVMLAPFIKGIYDPRL